MPLPIAEKWYETRRVSDAVTLIFELHVGPGLRCNIWHVRGRDRDLLVDSGLGLSPLKDTVARLSEHALTCVASHSHFDHVGGHHEFDDRRVHPAEAHIMRAPDRHNTVIEDYMSLEQFSALPFVDFDPERYTVRVAEPTGTLDEGDVLDLGDRHFSVLHLPGHSPGSIALWEEASGTLFSGDVLYDGELFDRLYHSCREDYVRSLERLRTLPVQTVHAGHYASFGRERLLELVDAYLCA